MRRHLLISAAVVVSLLPAGANASSAPRQGSTSANASANPFVPGEVLVRFMPSASRTARAAAIAGIGGRIVSSIPGIEVHRVQLPKGGDVTAAVTRLSALRSIDFAEPNLVGTIASELLPNDRCFAGCGGVGRQWNLDAINAPSGWGLVPGRFFSQADKKMLSQVKVAVLDTKIDIDRLDWRNADSGSTAIAYDAANGGQLDMADAKDFLTNQNFDGAAAYHGTFVAGILGASADNASDIAGVAYGAQLMPVTVVDGSGGVNAADLASGIGWAVSRGARVINMSLIMSGESDTVKRAIDAALGSSLLIAAAGNSGSEQPFYPAAYTGVMSVTAATEADRPGDCSNRSSRTSVAAPGVGVVSLDPRASSVGGLSKAGCGTSTAAPHVAGLAALLFAQNPARSPLQVRNIIEATADDDALRPGFDEFFGHGRINIERALRYGSTFAEVLAAKSTIPVGGNGTSILTALARSTTSDPILEAEAYLGRITSQTRFELSAADGDFDSVSEGLTASVPTSLVMPAGVHRLFLRARTAAGWGPHTSATLVIDRAAPTAKLQDPGPFVAIPAASLPGAVTVALSDDYSLTGSIRMQVSRAFGDGSVVYESQPASIQFPSVQTLRWLPDLGASGLYRAKIYVSDAAGNPAVPLQADLLVLG